jgi:hypothetical protein
MGHYETMQVCLKGHQITDRYNCCPEFRQKFCDKCGSGTIYKCPKCGVAIRGYYEVEGIVDLTLASTPVTYNCHSCGNPYPWAKRLKIINFFKSLSNPIKFLLDIFSKIFKL